MYICQYCSRKFNDKYVMKRHQKCAKYCLRLQESVTNNSVINNSTTRDLPKNNPDLVNTNLQKCKNCGKIFNDIYNLKRHQRSAKYCLESQDIHCKKYNCQYCNKQFSRKDNLLRHEKKCQQEDMQDSGQDDLLIKVIDKYGEMVKDLQRQITELSANRSIANQTNNNNNRNVVMNNLQPITDDDLQKHLDLLSLDFIQEGAKGYADFAGNYPFKDKVICTDKSRKKLKYKNQDGELTDDGRVLAQRFFIAISERNTAILNQAYSDLHHEMQGIVADNRAGEVDVSSILSKATSLQDILIKSQRAAKGEDDQFAKEFLSHLSKIL